MTATVMFLLLDGKLVAVSDSGDVLFGGFEQIRKKDLTEDDLVLDRTPEKYIGYPITELLTVVNADNVTRRQATGPALSASR